MLLGAALCYRVVEVELLVGCGGFIAYQILSNSECYYLFHSSEGMGARSMSERERTQTIC